MARIRVVTHLLIAALVASASTLIGASPAFGVADTHPVHRPLEDLDLRAGSLAPTTAQRSIVDSLGADVIWNRYGTPHSLINNSGYLGTGDGSTAVEVARNWISEHRDLFRLSEQAVADLELVNDSNMASSDGHAVLFRQTFGGLSAAVDGMITVGVVQEKIAYVSSTSAGTQSAPDAPTLGPAQALIAGAANVDIEIASSDVSPAGNEHEWELFDVAGMSQQRVRTVALPTPSDGVRPAYEVLLLHDQGGDAAGYSLFVDGITGDVVVRHNLEDQLQDNPRWKLFKAYPPLNYKDKDTRVRGCWRTKDGGERVPGCRLRLKNKAARQPWDVEADTGLSTHTTKGNAANTALSSLSPFTPSDNYRPISPDREYIYPFTNHWYDSKCSRAPAPDPNESDVNSAIVNLFVSHNRLHDWSYRLGFTEENYNLQENNYGEGGRPGDPETGDAQAGYVTGGSPTYTGRDNANQITPPDGVSPITNMYLWQPIAAAFYSPCVDGDFDMSVIGHEYTHAISNRMVGGPDAGLGTRQGGSMGESWSDLTAVEYLFEHGYAPIGRENPWAVGAYVTGNKKRGIRNYGMNHSPLNFSDVGYDIIGAQVHADGEIWSATNFDIRKALIKKYNGRFPARNKRLQRRCANGKVPTGQCPGNRRWIQIYFDAFLLMPPDVTMLGARDAYLAAERMRFDGKNQKALWKAFAKRGFGKKAEFATSHSSLTPTTDDRARPSFVSPKSPEGSLRFVVRNTHGKRIGAKVYVGRYQARVTPVADTIKKTKRGAEARFVGGRYKFLVRAKGYGMWRFSRKVRPGSDKKVVLRLQKNLASKKNGAKARGDGSMLQELIDDNERTNWAATGESPNVKGTKVTVDLAGKRARLVRHVRVSAMLRPRRQTAAGQPDPQDPSQSRFSALRRFEIATCRATKANNNCGSKEAFKSVFVSSKRAFPGSRPRPAAPDLILRGFKVKRSRATHVRLIVLSNQCLGTPGFRGEQDKDPTNDTDCAEASSQDRNVRAAELQVFSRRSRLGR
ncbi:MAG: M36 family metallopeptidase [Actinomycetota bacterium]|nr:M36 family metallopeptidase [Actinomycetota bacterium]